MSEVWGVVVIPRLSELSAFKVKDIAKASDKFLETLFDVGGFNKKALVGKDYKIEKASLKGGYLMLSVVGDEWLMLANSAMRPDRYLEFYGSFSDEYGSERFFARNSAGQSYSYGFEEESDEYDQDDFDVDEYRARLDACEERWLAIAPEEVKKNFASVLPTKPSIFG